MFSSEESMAGSLLEHIQKEEEKYTNLTEDEQRLLKSKTVISKILEVLKHAEQISFRRRISSTSNKHGRYLCISNGATLVCLDLKDGLEQKPIDKLQPLPKIRTLVAADILGQQKDSHLSGTVFSCFVYAVKDSASCKMYRLSMDGANFCISEQDTSTINTPLHLSMLKQDESGNPEHLLIIPKVWLTCSASEIPNSFLYAEGAYEGVIADQVYAIDCYMKELMVYNTTTSKSSKYPFPKLWYGDMVIQNTYWPIPKRHVSELLRNAFVRCIGKLEQSDSSNPLFVVIAVMKGEAIPTGAASAYLVTSTGQVLCYQLLPHFFVGLSHFFTERSRKWECLQLSVISVGEEGKTWCAIVPMSCMRSYQRFLFISTFTVEEFLYDFSYGPLLPSILPEKREEGDDIFDVPLAQELHFLDVEMKEWNVYDLNMGEDMDHFTHLSACFLSTQ